MGRITKSAARSAKMRTAFRRMEPSLPSWMYSKLHMAVAVVLAVMLAIAALPVLWDRIGSPSIGSSSDDSPKAAAAGPVERPYEISSHQTPQAALSQDYIQGCSPDIAATAPPEEVRADAMQVVSVIWTAVVPEDQSDSFSPVSVCWSAASDTDLGLQLAIGASSVLYVPFGRPDPQSDWAMDQNGVMGPMFDEYRKLSPATSS